MKRLKTLSKQIFILFMTAVILSMTIAGNYMSAKEVKAASVAKDAEMSLAFLEMLLRSIGVTCDSMETLKGLNTRINNSGWIGELTHDEIEAYKKAIESGTIDLDNEHDFSVWRSLQRVATLVISDINRTDVVYECPSIPDMKIHYVSSVTESLVNEDFFNGFLLKGGYKPSDCYPRLMKCRTFLYSVKVSENGNATYWVDGWFSNMSDSSMKSYHLQVVNGLPEICGVNGNVVKLCMTDARCTKYFNNSYLEEEGYWALDKGLSYSSHTMQEVISTHKQVFDRESPPALVTTMPIYESYEEYVSVEGARTSNPVKGFIFGGASAALALTGKIVIPKTAGAITGVAEEAIEKLKTENPDATDADINAAVIEAISGISAVEDDVEAGNDLTAIGNSWLEKIYNYMISSLASAVAGVSVSVNSFTSIFNGYKDDILSGLGDITIGIGGLAGDIGQEVGSVVGGALDGWSKTWENSFDLVLGGWTDTLDKIADHINSLAFPDAIAIDMPLDIAWPDAIPVSLPGVLTDVITLDLPGILGRILDAILSIPNYMDILERILEAIKSIFGLDMADIQAAAVALTGALDDRFPDFDAVRSLFNKFKFSDKYAYPKIEVETPQILKDAGYQKDTIIFVDFADYAEYVIWCRRLLRCMLWLGYAYVVLKHFDVSFSVD